MTQEASSNAPACRDCRFWGKAEGESKRDPGPWRGYGWCHRFPPTAQHKYFPASVIGGMFSKVDVLQETVIPSAFPLTALDSFCGEYAELRQGEPK